MLSLSEAFEKTRMMKAKARAEFAASHRDRGSGGGRGEEGRGEESGKVPGEEGGEGEGGEEGGRRRTEDGSSEESGRAWRDEGRSGEGGEEDEGVGRRMKEEGIGRWRGERNARGGEATSIGKPRGKISENGAKGEEEEKIRKETLSSKENKKSNKLQARAKMWDGNEAMEIDQPRTGNKDEEKQSDRLFRDAGRARAREWEAMAAREEEEKKRLENLCGNLVWGGWDEMVDPEVLNDREVARVSTFAFPPVRLFTIFAEHSTDDRMEFVKTGGLGFELNAAGFPRILLVVHSNDFTVSTRIEFDANVDLPDEVHENLLQRIEEYYLIPLNICRRHVPARRLHQNYRRSTTLVANTTSGVLAFARISCEGDYVSRRNNIRIDIKGKKRHYPAYATGAVVELFSPKHVVKRLLDALSPQFVSKTEPRTIFRENAFGFDADVAEDVLEINSFLSKGPKPCGLDAVLYKLTSTRCVLKHLPMVQYPCLHRWYRYLVALREYEKDWVCIDTNCKGVH